MRKRQAGDHFVAGATIALALLLALGGSTSAEEARGCTDCWRVPSGELYFGSAPPPGSVRIDAVRPSRTVAASTPEPQRPAPTNTPEPPRSPVPSATAARLTPTAAVENEPQRPAPTVAPPAPPPPPIPTFTAVPPKPTAAVKAPETRRAAPSATPVLARSPAATVAPPPSATASPAPARRPTIAPSPAPASDAQPVEKRRAELPPAACADVVEIRDSAPMIDFETDEVVVTGDVHVKRGRVQDLKVCLAGNCTPVRRAGVLHQGETVQFYLRGPRGRPQKLSVRCTVLEP